MLRTIQIGLNTADMAGTLRLYSEAFGFVNAGSQAIWGPLIRLQGLEPNARSLMWWMLGRQKFFQLELFHHTEPKQVPLPADWRPCDIGWSRFGIAVEDLEFCLTALARHGISPMTPPVARSGRRRFAFRDPYVGVAVEVIEDDSDQQVSGPAIVYATSLVSDLESAHHFYHDLLGFEIGALNGLHEPADEALWGLAGAERDGFLVRTGQVNLEVLRYRNPLGQPKRADHRISDQGIMNVAFGSREPTVISQALQRLIAAGHIPPLLYDVDGIVCGYIIDSEREVELTSVPEAFDAIFGFAPVADFLR